jgi:TrmH family RNA methyltransferase
MTQNCQSISSSQNQHFKRFLQLRDSRQRRKVGSFLIEGSIEIGQALRSGLEIECFISRQGFDNDEIRHLINCLPGKPWYEITSGLMDRLAYGQVETRLLAVAKVPEHSLTQLKLLSSSLILVLDRTEKPGNLGACLRSAAAAGVDAVVLTSPICDLYNPNTIRASRGAVFTLPIAIGEEGQFRQRLQQLQIPVFAARVDGQRQLWDLKLSAGAAIVFGSESQGLVDHWSGSEVTSFVIPMSESVDSLNLSISSALTLYEARRQKMFGGR